MVSGFDLAATVYDSSFTHTPIGKLQRNRVYKFLIPFLNITRPLNILELNCGTGEDALFMAEKGHKILATDLSPQMLTQAKSKTHGHLNIRLQPLDINDLDKQVFQEKLDLIFSNFGGLNCISPLQFENFLRTAADKLVPGGHIIAVIMPKKCLWERFYYLFKGKRKMAYRRSSARGLEVSVEGKSVKTWYYNPKRNKTVCQGFIFKGIGKTYWVSNSSFLP